MARGSARARKVDDATIAEILRLHRTKKPDGRRHSYAEIAKATGVSQGKVSSVIHGAHAETVGSATAEIREKIADSLDINIERITGTAEALAHVARNGCWPDTDDGEAGETVKGMPRVVAAREAIEGSYKLLQVLGVKESTDELDPEKITARVRKVYGLFEDEDDEGPDEETPHATGGNGEAATVH